MTYETEGNSSPLQWHGCLTMDCTGGFWWDPASVQEGDLTWCQAKDLSTPAQRLGPRSRHRWNGERWQLYPGEYLDT